EDGRIRGDRGVLDAGDPVDTGLLPVLVNVIDEGRDVGKGGGVGDGPAVRIKAALPAGVDVDVPVAVALEAGCRQRVGLGGDIRLGQESGIDGLLTEGAPAEIWTLSFAVDLGGCGDTEGKEESRGECGRESPDRMTGVESGAGVERHAGDH